MIHAEGESKAAELFSSAIKTHGAYLLFPFFPVFYFLFFPGSAYLELKKIDAAVQVAQNLANSRNVTYLPGKNNLLINTNLT
jgi:hypothetical protein